MVTVSLWFFNLLKLIAGVLCHHKLFYNRQSRCTSFSLLPNTFQSLINVRHRISCLLSIPFVKLYYERFEWMRLKIILIKIFAAWFIRNIVVWSSHFFLLSASWGIVIYVDLSQSSGSAPLLSTLLKNCVRWIIAVWHVLEMFNHCSIFTRRFLSFRFAYCS